MAPRADFECATYCKTVYADLPVASTRCPVCGKKRGFKRLFNAIQVSTDGHKVAQFIDASLGPQMHQHALRQGEVKASERRLNTERDMMYEKGTDLQRQAIAQHGPPLQWQGARAFGTASGLSIPAEARAASAWPFVKRNVVPRFQGR